ncbi:MAG: hypothetical protein GQF41_1024 [Candidatus Rifleibacterium amylolyticum]|nr:MAG: hypothetical protein GQF41_1024 [Candidatus Rifleibacterium amylolyticum]NLF98241.1 CRISPR-associated endonuclease Cas2 [Candidatus Riflebacteria bacterium]
MERSLTEFIVCYDVKCDKRRKKLFDALKDTGLIHVQESVFWGWLNPSEAKCLPRLFEDLLDDESDRAFAVKARMTGCDRDLTYGYQDGFFSEFKPYETI